MDKKTNLTYVRFLWSLEWEAFVFFFEGKVIFCFLHNLINFFRVFLCFLLDTWKLSNFSFIEEKHQVEILWSSEMKCEIGKELLKVSKNKVMLVFLYFGIGLLIENIIEEFCFWGIY